MNKAEECPFQDNPTKSIGNTNTLYLQGTNTLGFNKDSKFFFFSVIFYCIFILTVEFLVNDVFGFWNTENDGDKTLEDNSNDFKRKNNFTTNFNLEETNTNNIINSDFEHKSYKKVESDSSKNFLFLEFFLKNFRWENK